MATTSETIERLYGAARDAIFPTVDKNVGELLENISATPWTHVHDWRNHLPDVVVELWETLPIEAKIVAFIFAASAARSEDWD